MTKPIAERCEGWGECFRLRILRGQALSFEGTSRSNRFSAEQGAPNVAPSPDVFDAQIIEDATVLVPLYHHLLLRFHYIRRWSPGKCLAEAAEGAKVPRSEWAGYESSLNMAHALLLDALTVPSVVRKVRVRQMVKDLLDDGAGIVRACAAQVNDGRSRYSARWEGGALAGQT